MKNDEQKWGGGFSDDKTSRIIRYSSIYNPSFGIGSFRLYAPMTNYQGHPLGWTRSTRGLTTSDIAQCY